MMFMKFLVSSNQGRFLIFGIIALIMGFVLAGVNPLASKLAFYVAIFFLGYYATKNAITDTIENKKLNVDLLMVLAAFGACLINYESEGALLLLIFAISGLMEEYADGRSTRAIEELMSQVPKTAQLLLANGETKEVSVDELKIGDTIVVAKGNQVPIDGVIDRESTFNEAALTGESVPVTKGVNDEVFGGTINIGHSIQMKVNKLANETVFSNIVHMVEEAESRPSNISKFIDRIESKYVITVLIAVPIFIFILMTYNKLPFQEAFYRGMVFLTVASPCALVAAATPATLSAISNGARNGILFKGGAAMEALSTMDMLFSDKTGTLTYGNFEVVEAKVSDELLGELVHMEQASTHPIAKAIVEHFSEVSLVNVNKEMPVKEISGSGLEKGDIRIGKPSDFKDVPDPHHYLDSTADGLTTVIMSKGNEVVGYLNLADKIREESKTAVEKFRAEGVDVVLLTGDNQKVAQLVADEVGIQHFEAGLLPEDKIKYVFEEQKNDHVVGMIGDGINDAPALANANIGIAMGSGSSVAMESSDVVIVKNDLLKLFYSFKLSQRLNQIILQNVFFAGGVIVILILLNILGLLPLPLAVVFHEGSTILVILNGLRLLMQQEQETDKNK